VILVFGVCVQFTALWVRQYLLRFVCFRVFFAVTLDAFSRSSLFVFCVFGQYVILVDEHFSHCNPF